MRRGPTASEVTTHHFAMSQSTVRAWKGRAVAIWTLAKMSNCEQTGRATNALNRCVGNPEWRPQLKSLREELLEQK
jgi:hypothetical protein